LGDAIYNPNSRIESMGITGIALTGNNINPVNPAANNNLTNTVFSVGMKLEFLKSTDGTIMRNQQMPNFYGINLGIPVYQDKGTSLNFGFNPLSQINYKISGIDSAYGQTLYKTYTGIGGLSKLNAGFSFSPIPAISIGAEYDYVFGSLKKLSLLDFGNQKLLSEFL